MEQHDLRIKALNKGKSVSCLRCHLFIKDNPIYKYFYSINIPGRMMTVTDVLADSTSSAFRSSDDDSNGPTE